MATATLGPLPADPVDRRAYPRAVTIGFALAHLTGDQAAFLIAADVRYSASRAGAAYSEKTEVHAGHRSSPARSLRWSVNGTRRSRSRQPCRGRSRSRDGGSSVRQGRSGTSRSTRASRRSGEGRPLPSAIARASCIGRSSSLMGTYLRETRIVVPRPHFEPAKPGRGRFGVPEPSLDRRP